MDAVVTREHGECSQTVGLLLAVGSLVFDTASQHSPCTCKLSLLNSSIDWRPQSPPCAF